MDLISLVHTPNFKVMRRRKNTAGMVITHYDISGVSSDNDYVPLFAPIVNKGIFNKKIVHYSLPKTGNYTSTSHISSYSRLYSALEKSTQPIIFQTKSMDFKLLIIKGAIFEFIDNDNVKLLFTVGVKEDYMVKMFSEPTKLDKSKFVIFVSQEFMSEDKYKTLYRRINKEVIIPHLKRGIDIITTNSIVDKCFNEEIKHPKFKDVTEMIEYLDAFNS